MQDEFNKVFDSQNSSFTYDFTNESLEADFRGYLSDMRFWDKWQHNSKESMLKRVSSVCIVDMPQIPGNDTEPYFYFQDISGVVDFDYHSDYYQRGKETFEYSVIDAIILNQGPDQRLMIDEKRYAMFKKAGDKWILAFESFHTLGYCPACFFWQDMVDRDQPAIKKSLVTGALGGLDYLLFGETSRRCNEIGAAFPIVVAYKENCTYYKEVDNNRYKCERGLIDTPKGQMVCPVCERNRMIGPGTVLKVTPPKNQGDPDNINAVNIVSPDAVSLTHWTDRSDDLWDEIYYDCVGSEGETTKQAINTDQVHGNFESKLNILLKAKSNLEISHTFVVATIARLRYEGSFIGCSINYGTKFYLQNSADAQNEYAVAKKAGVPAYQLGYKRQLVDMVNTKGNPEDAIRLEILQELEPWVDYNIDDAKLLGLMEIDVQGYLLKADFSNRIKRFEAEFGSIVEFGSKLSHALKIEKIKAVLISYSPKQITLPQPLTETGRIT